MKDGNEMCELENPDDWTVSQYRELVSGLARLIAGSEIILYLFTPLFRFK